MRRAILAVTIGGLLLTGTACDSDAETVTTAPAPAPSIETPSVAPTTPPPDYTANTRLVCGRLDKIFNDDIAAFGKEIGRMIAYKESRSAAEAAKAEKAAGTRLRAVATNIRKVTGAAEDPAIKTAGTATAAKLTRVAGDDGYFDAIRTQRDFDRNITTQLGEWLSPVSGYCA